MTNYFMYPIIGFIIFYGLYSKGIILANFEFVDPNQAMDIIQNEENNMTILDVRTPDEYKMGHIKNSTLIPLQSLSKRLDELHNFKDKKVLVYCASGSRSISASRILEKNGFSPYNMNGGVSSWVGNGYKITK